MVIVALYAYTEASPSFRLKEHSKLYTVKEQPSSTSGPFTGKIRRFQTDDSQVIVLQTAPLSVTLLSTQKILRNPQRDVSEWINSFVSWFWRATLKQQIIYSDSEDLITHDEVALEGMICHSQGWILWGMESSGVESRLKVKTSKKVTMFSQEDSMLSYQLMLGSLVSKLHPCTGLGSMQMLHTNNC